MGLRSSSFASSSFIFENWAKETIDFAIIFLNIFKILPDLRLRLKERIITLNRATKAHAPGKKAKMFL